MATKNISIIVVDKTGKLKSVILKEYNESELYKKCGFKKSEGFSKQTEWGVKLNGNKYSVRLYGKVDGKANTENKYDFPPPLDTVLFFGSCVLVNTLKKEDGTWEVVSLTTQQWEKMYENLFGGFEDLAATANDDEDEEDELALVSKDKKTKHGYLKDGFVVDSNSEDEDVYDTDDDCDSDEVEDSEDTNENGGEDGLTIEDIGSELSEEDYETEEED
jgi:hypothetical protein